MHAEYKTIFENSLTDLVSKKEPKGLYEPIAYILEDGGKRVRPSLVLLGCGIYTSDFSTAISAAKAIEIFHNFTLVHDDIMDAAPLRRNRATVHEKWDTNTAILSGDAMLILAYQQFEEYEPNLQTKLLRLFSKTALEVCEGQQWDVEFASRPDIDLNEYIKMITYKTAVLVACALKMGALIGGAVEQQAQLLYDFGLNLGIAFQIQDDYLDAFGNPETFGKQVGGDIIENKKTYLYIKANILASADQKLALQRVLELTVEQSVEKIARSKELFLKTGAAQQTLDAIKHYTDLALAQVEKLTIAEESKTLLRDFSVELMTRKS